MTKKHELLANNISNWIKCRVELYGKEGIVLGLSGGIDSAVVAGLACIGDVDIMGLIMPCYSDEQDEKDAMLVAKHFNISNIKKIDLTEPYNKFIEVICSLQDFIEKDRINPVLIGNIKARLRMITLYHYAGLDNRLVAGTGNKCELYVGYFTKWGDGACDLLPLANILKSDVYGLAEYLNIPEQIMIKKPSAGLYPGQTDEKEMGITYNEIEDELKNIKRNLKVFNRHCNNMHKLDPIDVYKL